MTSPSSNADSARRTSCRKSLPQQLEVSLAVKIFSPLLPLPNFRNAHSQWPRGLRRGSAAARLLGLRVFESRRGVCMSVSYKCCMLSGMDLCDGPILHPEEFYRVCVCLSVISCNSDPLRLQ
jgi:hypothetical protein